MCMGCFKTLHIGQYLSGSSVSAHPSHTGFPQFWHILSPAVGLPHITHGSSTSSKVIVALTLWLISIPIPFARAGRLKSMASNHSRLLLSTAITLSLKTPVAEIFFFFSKVILYQTPKIAVFVVDCLFYFRLSF